MPPEKPEVCVIPAFSADARPTMNLAEKMMSMITRGFQLPSTSYLAEDGEYREIIWLPNTPGLMNFAITTPDIQAQMGMTLRPNDDTEE